MFFITHLSIKSFLGVSFSLFFKLLYWHVFITHSTGFHHVFTHTHTHSLKGLACSQGDGRESSLHLRHWYSGKKSPGIAFRALHVSARNQQERATFAEGCWAPLEMLAADFSVCIELLSGHLWACGQCGGCVARKQPIERSPWEASYRST